MRPMMFLVGTHPQNRLSELLVELSPRREAGSNYGFIGASGVVGELHP